MLFCLSLLGDMMMHCSVQSPTCVVCLRQLLSSQSLRASCKAGKNHTALVLPSC